jgi:hypothetical protein
VGTQPLRGLPGPYYLALGVILVGALAALGGASRADELQQSLIRLIAIMVIAAAMWPLNPRIFREGKVLLVGLATVYLLLLAQLIPLPPQLWARMPNHAAYAAVAAEAQSLAWRPWTLSPDLTLNALAALLPATAAALVTLALDFQQRLLVARLLIGIACASAVFGLLQFAAGDSALHLFRTTSEASAVGLFANRNHQAVLMACALPLLAATASIRLRKEPGGQRRIVSTALVEGAVILFGLAATGSRMGMLLGAIAIAGAIVIILITVERRRPASGGPLGFWISGGTFGLAAFAGATVLIMRSGAAARLASEPIDQTRIAPLGPMLHAARAFMPFGSGLGTFQPVYQQFEPTSLLSTIYLNQAHNEPMQLAIEGGLPAIFLLLSFLGWWLQAVVQTTGQKTSLSRRALGTAMVVGSLILLLSSLVDYPLRTPLLSSFFAIACVELLLSRRRPGDHKQ